jgi:uncharacterized protein YqeY
MTVGERLTEDMKTSMRAGDTVKTGTLRLLRSAMKNEEIRLGHALSESEAVAVLRREAKQRRDSITAYESAGRTDLVDREQAESAIIDTYLPPALPESELVAAVEGVIAQMGATGLQQMGAVVSAVKSIVGDRVEGGDIARLVRERLTGTGV